MKYEVSLKDVIEGLQKCFDGESYLEEYVRDLADNDGNLDLPEAETLLQVITFGNHIYG